MCSRLWIWIAFTTAWTFGTPPLVAQIPTNGTSSHRHIPYGEAPTRDAFRTAEYEQAKDAYQQLQQLARSLANQGIGPFAPDGAGRGTPGRAEQSGGFPFNNLGRAEGGQGWPVPQVPTLPGSIQQGLSEGLSEDSIADFSQNIGKGLVEWNQALRGGTAGSSLDASSTLEDIGQQLQEARQTYYDQRRMVSRSYQEAWRNYREKWPKANIPPQELLDTLQPFISEEVLEQLIKVRDYREGKLTAPPKIPDHLLPPKPPSSLSDRVFESVARSIDKGGVELLKQAQQRNQGKQAVSWWKRLRKQATSSVRSVNQSITENAESYATASAPTVQRIGSGSGTGNAGGSSVGGLLAVFLLAVSAIAAWFAWSRHAAKFTDAEMTTALEPAAIEDPSSVLQAVHRIAAQHLGSKSRYWHHQKLFASLQETLCDDFGSIAALYERLRYAPRGHHVSQDELSEVRRWYRKWLDVDTVRPQRIPLPSSGTSPSSWVSGKPSV